MRPDGGKFLVNYGWECVWRDFTPRDRVYIKDYIKGPFRKPNLATLYPVATFCQKNDTPNCKQSPDTMFEDLNSLKVSKEGNNRTGQGIPDPWTSYPYMGDIKTEIRNCVLEALKEKSDTKKRCLCCEKKYLFECPDEAKKNNKCLCKDCHTNEAVKDCGNDCRCVKVLKNWVLENVNLFLEKGQALSLNSIKNVDLNEQSTNTDRFSLIKYELDHKLLKNSVQSAPQDSHKKTCFCSYLKGFSFKKKKKPAAKGPVIKKTFCEGTRNSTASKQIQTEKFCKEKNRLEEDKTKNCICEMKETCPKCKNPDTVVSNVYLPHFHLPSQAFVCPYSCDGLKTKKHRKHKSSQVRNDIVENSNDEFSINLPDKDWKKDTILSSLKNKESIPTMPAAYDRLKFLTEIKLRNYLQKKEFNSGILRNSYNIPSSYKFSKLYEENTPLGKIEVEKWTPPGIGVSKRFDSAVQTTPRDIPTKVTFAKGILESDDSKTYGLVRHCEGSCQTVRRRRKLLVGRKKRKSLSRDKSLVLVKPSGSTACRGTGSNLKNISLETFDKGNKTCLMGDYQEVSGVVSRKLLDANEYFDGVVKQRHETVDVFERSSCKSGTSWSSHTVKSVVDGVLIEKPILHQHNY